MNEMKADMAQKLAKLETIQNDVEKLRDEVRALESQWQKYRCDIKKLQGFLCKLGPAFRQNKANFAKL